MSSYGLVQDCQAVSQLNNQTLYRVKLVPKLWELSLYHTNEVYLEMSTVDVIEQVLKEAGFTTQDYDISGLQGDYPVWPYRCQYGENHLDFISRLMERDGIYYYFIEGEVGEKVIFCDSMQAQESISKADVLYSPAASLEINSLANNVSSFINKKTRLPYKVLLKDYNDDKPSVDIKGEAVVDERAVQTSEIYVWGQNIQTPEEGEALAKVRAEELQSTKSMYLGESSVARLLIGHHFNLKGHFRSACNQEYLLVSIEHEAQNPSLLDFSNSSNESSRVYQNTFSAIPASSQYRHPQITAKPEIHGTLNAFVDAEGDGHYAELDEEGRYRITLPFDRVDRDGGKASHWIRMSQPYGGEGHGMSFPLRKGAEVLLTFIGGDPDRPVIAGTVPNASQPSVTTSDNQTNSIIKTAAGNKVELEDKDGVNRIKLHTGDNKTYMHLGAPNHDGDGIVVLTRGMDRMKVLSGKNYFYSVSGLGDSEKTGLFTHPIKDPFCTEAWKVAKIDQTTNTDDLDSIDVQSLIKFPKKVYSGDGENVSGTTTLTTEEELSGKYIISRLVGDRYKFNVGNTYEFGSGIEFDFGDSMEVAHWDPDPESDVGAKGAKSLIDTMRGYNLTGVIAYDGNPTTTTWSEMVQQGETELKQIDTFTAHNGNIYDFGGCWNYNLGNGYEENYISQKGTKINQLFKNDKATKGGPNCGDVKGKNVTVNSNSAWISKTKGDSYEVSEGNSISVANGNADSYTYGNGYDYVDGNSEEEVTGNSKSTVHGNSDEKVMGATSSMFLGASNSMSLAATNDMFVGIKNDMALSIANEVWVGLKNSFSAGYVLENDLAGKFEGIPFKTCVRATDMTAEANKIIARVNDITTGLSNIKSLGTALENKGLSLQAGGLTMIA